ncbi:hypothetical protein Pan44_06830 [Caulifigura coniformis]|uniref:Uncharacterized protein n=1 Tax=Caulifigura coniformis TaxID=2527983 RepID=A0A517S973_9PLAN|nr:hypothetical protein [Caulifigura coniformis]QDT52671.1 hypothetical protein Pan44_06830 [Caulifigura coniformis]
MSTVSRRDFTTQMTTVVSGAVIASLTTPVSSPAADPMPESTTSPAVPQPASPMAYDDHQLAVLAEWHPAPHLTDAMREGIREGLRHNRGLAERIRSVPLTHDVPPAFSFVIPPAQ